MSNTPLLHVVGGEDGEDGPKVSFAVHSWRRIVRDALTDPRLESLPCKKDLYLVALDFASLCDHRGNGTYSAKERRGRALEERPDPSLCELVEITDKQVSKMLKLLIALGFLRMTKKAAMGRQAEYEVTLPQRGIADVGECLAVAAGLGFKPAASVETRSSRTRKAREASHLKRAHEAARMVVDNAVDNSVQGSAQTHPSGECANTPSEECPDTPQEECVDTPPLPIGVFGNTGTTGRGLSTGVLGAGTGERKDDHLPGLPKGEKRGETVDGDPSGNRWDGAVTQAGIRRRQKNREDQQRAAADPCPGLDEGGCPRKRPVSPVNDEGLCVHCYGVLLAQRDETECAGAGDHGSAVRFDVPHMPPAPWGADGGTPA